MGNRHASAVAGSRLTASAFVAAGVLFVLYPAIRPFSDEATLSGAAAFASTAWLVAHSLAMAGFILLGLGWLGLYLHLRGTPAAPLALASLAVGWVGAGVTLPYYGAETFGLHAVGQEALRQGSPALLSLANSIRFEAGLGFVLVGLLALALGTILLAIAIWRSGTLARWSGVPLAAGFVLFLPQFFASQPLRIAHGALITAACLLLGAATQWAPRSARG